MKINILLIFLLLIFSVISLFVGVLDISFKDIFSLDSSQVNVFLSSRFPRLLAILLSGAALSIAGLLMQNLCQNNFVSPTTAGTISSAQLGILIALLFIPSSTIFTRAIFAFVAAMLGTVAFVAFIGAIKFKDTVMVALVGIMFSYVISGITSFLAFKFDMVQAMSSWLSGSFSIIIKGRYEILYLGLPVILISYIFANYFNIISLGKNFSKNLGLSYTPMLFAGLCLSAMLTACVVVVVGTIPYIGLIVPNLVRIFIGDNLKFTLSTTALFGALFVLICDIFARLIIFPYELPIELISGIIGSIIFIALIIIKLKNISIFSPKSIENKCHQK